LSYNLAIVRRVVRCPLIIVVRGDPLTLTLNGRIVLRRVLRIVRRVVATTHTGLLLLWKHLRRSLVVIA